MGYGSDFQLVSAIKGRLGATRYQGKYHVIHGGPMQGPPTNMVIAGIDHLRASLPPSSDPTPILAFFD
jgi:hypothetical protein